MDEISKKLKWDEIGKRYYETGVSNGVLYPLQLDNSYSKGFAWNGLSAVNENPSGAEATPVFADNIKYLNMLSAEEFGATVEAYTYPDEFAECDGSAEIVKGVTAGQQPRKMFGLSYKTLIGNDVKDTEAGYKLHLIYNAKASPSEKNYGTVNDNPEAMTLSWELTTTPVNVPGFKPTSHIVIDSRKCDSAKLKAFEEILYGSVSADPRLPKPEEVITLMSPGK